MSRFANKGLEAFDQPKPYPLLVDLDMIGDTPSPQVLWALA